MTASKKPVHRALVASPITWQAVERWQRALDMHGFPEVSKRTPKPFRAVTPILAGLVLDLQREKLLSRRETLTRLRAASAEQMQEVSIHYKGHRLVASLMLDWAVRGVLPLWIETFLPSWGNAGAGPVETARQLRALRPMIWPHDIVEGLSAVHRIRCHFERDADQSLWTAKEISSHAVVAGQLFLALSLFAEVLPHWLTKNVIEHNSVYWLGKRAADMCSGDLVISKIAGIREYETLAAIVKTTAQSGLPRLLDAVMTVRTGDSQQSVAARCVWTAPKTRAREVA